MKTKTTGIPFKDYNVNTSALSLSLASILCLSHLLPGGNKTANTAQDPGVARHPLRRYSSSPRPRAPAPLRARARLRIVYDALRQFRRKEGPFRPAFTTRHVLTFIQLPILPITKNFRPGDTRATRVTIQIGRAVVRIGACCSNSGYGDR